MIDMFTLALSHGLLALVILRVIKVRDPELPEVIKYKKPPQLRNRL